MYKLLIRPLLFLLAPEKVHHLVVLTLKIAFYLPFARIIAKKIFSVQNSALQREIAGLVFPNPVGLAAGFDKNASFYNAIAAFGFGSVEIGTVTPLGQPGNAKPRLFRLPADKALINRMGFNNLGLEAAKKQLSKKRSIIIGCNIGKNTLTPNEKAYSDYLTCFEGLYAHVDYFVVNVSCPNISDLHKLQDQDMLEQILNEIMASRAQKVFKKPVFLKISPDLNSHQVDETLAIVQKTAIDGLVISNTTVSREGLITPEGTIRSIGNGGLSGLPIRDRSTALIRYVAEKTNHQLPIIGVGGILSPADAIEKLKAGASLVQIYTGFIYEGPFLVKRINRAILNQGL
ncbi:MAG: quinone-dependent dihydroorotate dehydrogenase [Bacteroidota bacterium]|nr:MAG: quinone-dependent dihydroorotate dehydrogenase [Bacteroidota bacterium]